MERKPITVERDGVCAMDMLAFTGEIIDRLESGGLESMYLRCMHIEPGRGVDEIANAALKAARRGTIIKIRVDGYTEGTVDGDPAVPDVPEEEISGAQTELFKRFKSARNVDFEIERPIRLGVARYFSRDHRKGAIFRKRMSNGSRTDTVYVGGFNLTSATLGGYDTTYRTANPLAATVISSVLEKHSVFSRFQNGRHELSEGVDLMWMGGYARDPIIPSLIRDEQADGVNHVDIWAQYPPFDPRQIVALDRLHRHGVKITLYTNTESPKGDGLKGLLHRIKADYRSMVPLATYSPEGSRLHTKAAVISDNHDEPFIVWGGSHNFLLTAPGTTELAIRACGRENPWVTSMHEVLEKHKNFMVRRN